MALNVHCKLYIAKFLVLKSFSTSLKSHLAETVHEDIFPVKLAPHNIIKTSSEQYTQIEGHKQGPYSLQDIINH